MSQLSFPSTAVVLAGGLGTRLQSVIQELPKPMAPVAGRPFLTYVLSYLRQQGIQKVILSVGYKAELIREYFGPAYEGLSISYVVEEEPLGTGGAIKAAMAQISERLCFVLNGDTLFEADLAQLYQQHLKESVDLTIGLKQMKDFDRYGVVEMDEQHRIRAFKEKQYRSSGLINAGVYLIDQRMWQDGHFPVKFSFEKDVLEARLSQLKMAGCALSGYFIDIGIPEDLAKAQEDFKDKKTFPWATDASWTLFLDRDGVINQRIPGGYVREWPSFNFLPGVLPALAEFGRIFGRLIVVTNQQGVSKGLMSVEDVEMIHRKMKEEVGRAGGRIDRVYYCPDAAWNNPPCRKPNTGMGLEAKKDFPEIDFIRSVMVGDSISDMLFGQRLGMKTVLIESKTEELKRSREMKVNLRCKSLAELASLLQKRLPR